jgi:hypothetical protein
MILPPTVWFTLLHVCWVRSRLGGFSHGCLGQRTRLGAPRNHFETFEDGRAVPIERSVWKYQGCSGFHAQAAGNVLNDGRGDIGGAPKTPYGLENLQLHQQCHLRRGCSRNGRRPLALIEAWTEELLQVAWGQPIR